MALASVLVVEGVVYALFPEQMRKMMRMAMTMPEMTLRITGLVAVVLGMVIIYAMK
ncbi:DUF2065 domain-containing protein [Emcibacter nanhaiensis]|uniref:DUF2065 domain-containing protein n=1 Tax=Emcibacter nanhaiensis TaxID=1505037 RepID=A0A501PBH2_9PROT|nr:DUF2065 domain-containing protein [Emcibacter nanhaiensis]TPD57585.1 DUF2065 domain-containing protein [Emcibacter nanhaiensis]